MHLLIHDIDRDGWGSAALLCAALGPEQVRLHPMRGKDALGALRSLAVEPSTQVWVLDIPAPRRWPTEAPHDVLLPLRWVDHHMASWRKAAPPWVDVRLPKDDRPTTTMSLLLWSPVLRALPEALTFVRTLCSPESSPWSGDRSHKPVSVNSGRVPTAPPGFHIS